VTSLTKLTVDQEALLPVIRDEWLGHGLCTDRADREEAQQGVADAYRSAGLEPPAVTVWLDSPFGGAIGAALLGQVWDQVRGQVSDQVSDQVWGQVRDQVGDQASKAVYGQHDAGWLGWVDAFDRLGLHDATAPAQGLRRAAKAVGWWWPMSGAVILTERPTSITRDDLHRLHSETGPAISYPDGWGIWAIHGVRVPRLVVEHPDQITTEAVLAEPNQEVRRVMADRYGWDRLAEEGRWHLIDSCPDPGNPGQTLRLWDLPAGLNAPTGNPGDGTVRLLTCVNGTVDRDGTRRQFGLTVPGDAPDALTAAAGTYRMSRDDYALLARRI
jgi:hypothetical protein